MTNILVVDDAVDGAESLAMLLDACGHETHVAFDGLQGLADARRFVPHIIFLDLDMPVLDGFGAARAIRKAPETNHPFIVALTANSDTDVERRAVDAGFDFYLRKPADTALLLALVDELGARERSGAPLQA